MNETAGSLFVSSIEALVPYFGHTGKVSTASSDIDHIDIDICI
jgi:hypothetical protein